MSTKRLLEFENRIILFTTKWLNNRFWLLKASLILVGISCFFSCPDLKLFPNQDDKGGSLNQKIERPFQNLNALPGSHQSKLTFRMTIPLFANFLNLSLFQIKIIEIISAVLLLFFALQTGFIITEDKTISFFIGVAISTIYAGNAGFIDSFCYFDAIPYFFLVLCVFMRNPFTILMISSFAFWCDERALINSSFLFIYYILPVGLDRKIMLKNYFNKQVFAIVTAWFLYFLGRALLIVFCGFNTDFGQVGFTIFRAQVNHLPVGVWSGFEGLWFLVLLSLLVLFEKKHYFLLAACVTAYAVGIITSMSVIDIQRSMAFMLPAVFVALKLVSKTERKGTMQRIALRMALVSIVCLNYYYVKPFHMKLNNSILPIQIYKNITFVLQQYSNNKR